MSIPAPRQTSTLAVTGLVLGWINVGLWIVGIIAFIMFFGGLAWLAAVNS